jgi:hypothetical protein
LQARDALVLVGIALRLAARAIRFAHAGHALVHRIAMALARLLAVAVARTSNASPRDACGLGAAAQPARAGIHHRNAAVDSSISAGVWANHRIGASAVLVGARSAILARPSSGVPTRTLATAADEGAAVRSVPALGIGRVRRALRAAGIAWECLALLAFGIGGILLAQIDDLHWPEVAAARYDRAE